MVASNREEGSFECPQPVAIIGMACRFPGGVNGPREFWDFLLAGGDGIVPVPASRWSNRAYHDPDREKKARMYVDRGGFIEGMDRFDPLFFGISPAEASQIDPQHRWLLEITYEALENAGLKASELRGSNTSVYIGQFMHDYEQVQLDASARGMFNSHTATGPSMTLTSNRISHAFDFRGASITLDTACSSSLVAVDLACKAIYDNDCELAIAGGVNILLRPELTMAICKASMLSPDGRCKSFDERANGYVRSEGAGVVLLKKLSAALRDRNDILAVIRGSGVNQDGYTVGITVPSGAAQEALLRRSLARAGLDGQDIQYVEAHGTGTAIGDPTEVNALGAVLGARPADRGPCVIGSVKSNIGHLESAAGVAGLIKAVLAMSHGKIPANLHFQKANSAIDFDALRLRVADVPQSWPDTDGAARRAIVNSFGFGGTNANVVLEQAAGPSASCASEPASLIGATDVLVVSSKTEEGLKQLAARYAALPTAAGEAVDVRNLCMSAATRREHHKHRLAVFGNGLEALRAELDAFVQGRPSASSVKGQAVPNADAIAFVFSGMGTQWTGMGSELYRSAPVFRAAFDRCSAALEAYSGWSLVERVFSPGREPIDDAVVAQPAIFAVQVALSALLEAWGISPRAVVGHSAGEVAAAYVSGALSFEDAVLVVHHRSRLQAETEGMGKMLAIGVAEEALERLLAGLEDKVSIAAINAPEAVTLSGDAEALSGIAARLVEQGVFARFLSVGVPYHSPAMDRIVGRLTEALAPIQVNAATVPLYSTVSGARCVPGDFSAEYWARNVRNPVLFGAAIDAMARDGLRTFLEVSPHSALASSIQKKLAASGTSAVVCATLSREKDDEAMIARAVASLHVGGFPLDWRRLYPSGRAVALPNYVWQHDSYWYETEEARRTRIENLSRHLGAQDRVHPLVGAPLNSRLNVFQNAMDLEEQVYLSDHQLDGQPVFPAAGYVEMALAVGRRHYGDAELALEDIQFTRLLFLDREEPTMIEIAFEPEAESIAIGALDRRGKEWSMHSQASIVAAASIAPSALDLDAIRARCGRSFGKAEFYDHCTRLGLSYQGAFRVIEEVRFEGDEALSEIALPDQLVESACEYVLHPVMLDGAFQGLFATADRGYVPVRIAELRYYRRPPTRSFCYLRITQRTPHGIHGDVVIADLDGTIAVEVRGLVAAATRTEAGDAGESAALYGFRWERSQAQALQPTTRSGTDGKWILVADSSGIALRIASELASRGESAVLVLPENTQAMDAVPPRVEIASEVELLAIFRRYAAQCRAIIYLRTLDAPSCDALTAAEILRSCHHATAVPLMLAQSIAKVDWPKPPPVYFFTQGAHQLDTSDPAPQPGQGALWGFARVFASEFPAHACTLVDLSVEVDALVLSEFVKHALSDDYEQELAFRSGAKYVARLGALGSTQLARFAEQPYLPAGLQPYRVRRHSSVGQESFSLQAFTLPPPDEDELQIDVKRALVGEQALAAGRDTIVGCVGVVRAVGHDCLASEPPRSSEARFAPGEEVIALSSQGLASNANSKYALAARKPRHLSTDQAVLLPTVWLAAHYALTRVAQLHDGCSILIHDTASAIGLAALQLARLRGATVFVSVSDLAERARLLEAGAERILDATSAGFAELIRNETGGRGLDVVLIASGKRPLTKLVGVLKPLGRFVNIGARSCSPAARAFDAMHEKSISYSSVDISLLAKAAPALYGQLLREVVELFETRAVVPFSVPVYPAKDAAAALSHLRSPQAHGAVALCFETDGLRVAPASEPNVVNDHSTYLVTGGLGGLGLEVMHWLVAKGARSVVLVGRSAPAGGALGAIEAARARGARITTLRADIAVPVDVSQVLSTIERDLPPLAGIFHVAGVLDDGVIIQQSEERFRRVLRPKVIGAWNLHEQTAHLKLDMFVLFSSIASVVGWAGQSNYAAANAFLDTFAHYRRALGKPALSINWGPWSGSGMAANLDDRSKQRMLEAGLTPLSAAPALRTMDQLLRCHAPQGCVFDVDWTSLFRHELYPARKTVFQDLMRKPEQAQGGDFRIRFDALPGTERLPAVAAEVRAVVASVLGFQSEAHLDPDANISNYGLNSLMSMDLLNRLQAVMQTKLPATLVLKHPSVNAMAACIAQQLGDAQVALVAGEELYWDPKAPELVWDREINGPLATLGPTVVQFMYERHTTHFNVGNMVEIDAARFDLASLKIALRILFTYQDGCRLQVFPDGTEMKQEIVPLGGDVPMAEHDLRGLGYEVGARRMQSLNDDLHRSMSFTRGDPLYRAAYYQLDGDTPHRFFLIFHHYISDGRSQRLLSQQFASVYEKVLSRKPVFLPRKTYTLLDWTRRLYEFAHHEVVSQLPYWLEQIERAKRCEIRDEFVLNRPRRIDDRATETVNLERTETTRLKEYCRSRNLELADVATCAIVNAFTRLTGTEALWVELVTHARSGVFPDVAIPELFGQIAETGAVLFELPPGAPHTEQVAAVRRQRLEMPNVGLGLPVLRLINRDPVVKEQIRMHDTPQVRVNIDATDYAEEAAKNGWVRFAREGIGATQAQHLRRPAEELRLAFYVLFRLCDGRLTLSIDYYRDRFHQATIQVLIKTALSWILDCIVVESKTSTAPERSPERAAIAQA